MIMELYYRLSRLLVKMQVADLGKNARFRLSTRIINGSAYVHLGNNIEASQRILIAVYPEFAGKKNPVQDGGGVWIGDGTSFNRDLTVYCAGTVSIGKNCMFGSNILITDNDHGMNAGGGSYSGQPLIVKKTVIEDECWIGQNCCILAGSRIGKKSIIGAGSVVKGEIPSYSIAVGSPARVVKRWDFDLKKWVK